MNTEKQIRHIIAYVSLYRVNRVFGGREEGGWWYDAPERIASIPVAAKQTWILSWDEDLGTYATAEPCDETLIEPVDAKRVDDTRSYLVDLFNVTLDTCHRFSSSQRDDDYMLVVEVEEGERELTERPRYE